jgi:hypothetical protein
MKLDLRYRITGSGLRQVGAALHLAVQRDGLQNQFHQRRQKQQPAFQTIFFHHDLFIGICGIVARFAEFVKMENVIWRDKLVYCCCGRLEYCVSMRGKIVDADPQV